MRIRQIGLPLEAVSSGSAVEAADEGDVVHEVVLLGFVGGALGGLDEPARAPGC